MFMRPSDPILTKMLAEAHLETLRGGRQPATARRVPRRN
jgi:hypothetical protein